MSSIDFINLKEYKRTAKSLWFPWCCEMKRVKKKNFQKRKDDNNQFKERPSVVKRLSRVALGTDVTTEHIYLAPDEQE